MRNRSNSMRTIMRNVSILLPIAVLISCSGPTIPAVEEDHPHEQGAEHGPEVVLTAEQVEVIGLVTGKLEQRGLKTALKANGRLALPPGQNAQVSVLIGGIVRSVQVEEGQHVAKGEVLAILENLEFLQLQQDYLESAANLHVLDADLERQQDLQTDRINATKTLERAQADLSGARARQATLAAKLRIFGTDPARLSPETISSTFALRAPIAGNLKRINVNLGQFAEPNKPLFEVVDNRGLHIDLSVFEQDIARVRIGQQVAFGHAGEPVGQHTATVFAVNKAFENDQQAVLVHARLDDNDEELLPGMYIEALIMTDSTQAWSLPSDAVVNNGDDHFIFVEGEPNTFQQVAVRTGASELGYTEVKPLTTVTPDARIVIKGAYYLLSELTKGSGEHNH
ncbi:MAG TPA: efflux RND transporter periplasmic adaptor subunit [Flavobacteriales bacterium]|nr:efflux RND transporter periplasmic adaptor subunit [Flavobacteriales bacterium]MBK6550707.1 efflux RND transporter periplasmic adaptor subunit [Flavobacteriales bacterium]MBK7103335.1 efflux RND transporter periplasmic adaptor subunit [Flavobacteriales bacterium]MBK7112718.1 efflux RND transporter periplasmic adaptor subunit [Flavobacteriales bacterium]MBK8708443.1 efflux RND transporter periplasmic adaptor subunit [Flavobacteriales bacterium]